jgi:hypothetical protein
LNTPVVIDQQSFHRAFFCCGYGLPRYGLLLTLFLCGIYVGWTWMLAEDAIVPKCATGVDLKVTGTVLDVRPRAHNGWAIDIKVGSRDQPTKRMPLLGSNLRDTSDSAANADTTETRRGTAAGAECPSLTGKRLLLGWRERGPPRIGQSFVATVKLKAPWGPANPGAFDYERWLIAAGFAGTGYVREVHYLGEDAKVPRRAQWGQYFKSALTDRGLV